MNATPTPRTGRDAGLCPLCGGDNRCETARTGEFAVDCWCRAQAFPPALVDRAAGIDADRCVCQRCARAADDGRGS